MKDAMQENNVRLCMVEVAVTMTQQSNLWVCTNVVKKFQNEMFHSATTLGVAGHDGTDGSVTILGMEGKMITATMM